MKSSQNITEKCIKTQSYDFFSFGAGGQQALRQQQFHFRFSWAIDVKFVSNVLRKNNLSSAV